MVSRIVSIFRRKDREPDCDEVRDISSDYIDGELDEGELDERRAGRVKSHLDGCAPCNAFIRTLRATINLLRSTPKEQAPEGFRSRVRESLSKDRSG